MKIYKFRFNTDCGKFAFANRVVDEWNLLSEDVISCNTVTDPSICGFRRPRTSAVTACNACNCRYFAYARNVR